MTVPQRKFALLFHNVDRAVGAGNRLVDFNRFQSRPNPIPNERMDTGQAAYPHAGYPRIVFSEQGGAIIQPYLVFLAYFFITIRVCLLNPLWPSHQWEITPLLIVWLWAPRYSPLKIRTDPCF